MVSRKLAVSYNVFSFICSLYLLFSIIVEYSSKFSGNFKEINAIITYLILGYFVLEMVVLFFLYPNNIKTFLKDNWISVVAILASISIMQIFHLFAGFGIVAASNILIFAKYLKAIKILKLFKLAKVTKVVKSVKLGKKVVKNVKEIKKIRKSRG